ncbi:unnamed protein product [Closterium sp. Yama58-4]|nr:unnamed protein product [Closterium sp. Yama58-4]
MANQPELEVAVYLHNFHNLDLLKQGWYGVKVQCLWDSSGRLASPSRVLQYAFPETHKGEALTSWRVDDSDSSYHSRYFRIRFARQDVGLREVACFHLPVRQKRPFDEPVSLRFELLHAPFTAGRGNVPPDDLDPVARQIVRIPGGMWHHVHEYTPATFDTMHFAQLDVTVHAAMLHFSNPPLHSAHRPRVVRPVKPTPATLPPPADLPPITFYTTDNSSQPLTQQPPLAAASQADSAPASTPQADSTAAGTATDAPMATDSIPIGGAEAAGGVAGGGTESTSGVGDGGDREGSVAGGQRSRGDSGGGEQEKNSRGKLADPSTRTMACLLLESSLLLRSLSAALAATYNLHHLLPPPDAMAEQSHNHLRVKVFVLHLHIFKILFTLSLPSFVPSPCPFLQSLCSPMLASALRKLMGQCDREDADRADADRERADVADADGADADRANADRAGAKPREVEASRSEGPGAAAERGPRGSGEAAQSSEGGGGDCNRGDNGLKGRAQEGEGEGVAVGDDWGGDQGGGGSGTVTSGGDGGDGVGDGGDDGGGGSREQGGKGELGAEDGAGSQVGKRDTTTTTTTTGVTATDGSVNLTEEEVEAVKVAAKGLVTAYWTSFLSMHKLCHVELCALLRQKWVANQAREAAPWVYASSSPMQTEQLFGLDRWPDVTTARQFVPPDKQSDTEQLFGLDRWPDVTTARQFVPRCQSLLSLSPSTPLSPGVPVSSPGSPGAAGNAFSAPATPSVPPQRLQCPRNAFSAPAMLCVFESTQKRASATLSLPTHPRPHLTAASLSHTPHNTLSPPPPSQLALLSAALPSPPHVPLPPPHHLHLSRLPPLLPTLLPTHLHPLLPFLAPPSTHPHPSQPPPVSQPSSSSSSSSTESPGVSGAGSTGVEGGRKATRGKHVVVFVHGYQGHRMDLRLVRDSWRLLDPDIECLMAESNETNSGAPHSPSPSSSSHSPARAPDLSGVEAMGARLAHEVVTALRSMFGPIDRPNRKNVLQRLSFVGYSIGNLVVRAALADDSMRPYLPYLHLYLSFCGPHLGYMYHSNSLVTSGMWLLKRLDPSSLMRQLSFSDSLNVRDSCIYRLSQRQEWVNFKHIVLFASPQSIH